MRPMLIPALALAVCGAASAATMRTTLLEKSVHSSAGWKADFTQRFIPHGFKTAQVERGTVVFGPSPRMRWIYSAPEVKTFVFDGTTSWLYSPADRQVTVSRLNEASKREIPFLMISDSTSLHRHFTIQERTRDDTVVAEVRPRSRSGAVREVTVWIDKGTHRIRSLAYTDRQGNRTVFDFSGYRKAAQSDLAFHFTPPPGVEVVETQK
jgi:outer membrane lipoprotein carrier protein